MSHKTVNTAGESLKTFSGLWPLFSSSVWPSGTDKYVTSDNTEQKD